jgi:hypothetical protein
MGVAHLKKSLKVRSAEKAIITPTGLPTTVALLPMFVAKTSITTKGVGFTRYLEAQWIIVEVIKRMEVTSSTNAAKNADINIIEIISLSAFLKRGNSLLKRISKNLLSSRNPITIIIPIKKRMMSKWEYSKK